MAEPGSGTPPPSHQFRALTDRAYFVGEAARTGSQSSHETDPEEFQSLLAERVEPEKPDRSAHGPHHEVGLLEGESPEQLAQKAQETISNLTLTSEAQVRELERRTRKHQEEGAEHLGGSSWRGPTPILGLSVLAGGALQPGALTSPEKSRSEQRTEAAQEEMLAGEARVDPELLASLREAGLQDPLIGLADPRLAGSTPLLSAQEGWREFPQNQGVAFVWARGRAAYQRLEWCEGQTVLESAAGDRVQWLERRGPQILQRKARREVPRDFPGPT